MSAHRDLLERCIARFNDPAQRMGYLDLYAVDAVVHGYGPEGLHGLPAVAGFYSGIWEAFPDVAVHIDEVIEDGDRMAARFRMTGTHTGPFMGLPPSGRPFTVHGQTFLRFAEGRVAERWAVADFLGLMAQIGPDAPGLGPTAAS
jgi:steroid delta-isomerase-like uncharacterized protein